MPEQEWEQVTEVRETGPDFEPKDAVRMARGFTCLFWSLPVGMLLVSRVLTLRPGIRPAWFPSFWLESIRWPVHLGGLALFMAGLLLLGRALPDDRRWQATVTRALALAFVHGLLSPFLSWWETYPTHRFLLANVLVCGAALVLLLHQGDGLVAMAAKRAGDLGLHLEARLAAGLMAGFGLAAVAGFGFGQWGAARGQVDAGVWENWIAARGWGLVLLTLVLMPLTLTMSVLWKIKERCLDRLARASWG